MPNTFEKLRGAWKNARLRAVVFIGLAAAALFFLAAGLAQLELLPGLPLPMILQEEVPPGTIEGLPGGDTIIFILRVVYFIGLILLPFFVIYLVINPKARKQFLRDLLRVGAFLLMMYMLYNLFRSFRQQGVEELGEGGGGGLGDIYPMELVEFTPSAAPWLVNALATLLAVLLAGLVGVLLWAALRRRPAEQPLKQIAVEAQSALDAIEAGGDLRNIVIRCYAEMSRVLSEQRGIQRPADMTPREFETALARQGMPRQPVQALTRIFEEVRYGVKVPGEREERQARESLAAIVEACGGLEGKPQETRGESPV
jgi:hypothetical protein